MLLKILRACLQANPARLVRRGLALRQQGDLPAATKVLREAARTFPHDAVVAVNLALVLLEQNQADAGAAELERAMALDPANAAAHYNYANLLRVSGRHEEALRHYRLATQGPAPVAQAQQELMFSLLEFCAWDEAECVAERLREVCRQKSVDWQRVVAPLTAVYLGLDPAACKEVAAWHAAEAARDVAVLRRAPAAERARLRIGYLSQDCRDHPVGHLLSAALPLHDRSRCEVFAYSYGADDRSASRLDIERGVEHFVDIAALSDAAAAARIAADGVQVLIDLAGHTTGGRPGILARRPAPVQAHYLGYPASTGATYLDYFITDAVATPPACEAAFTEQLAFVPECFMFSAGPPPPVEVEPTRASQGLPAQAMVYSSFINASRISRDVFALWMEILRAVPDSVLWLKQSHAAIVTNLSAEAARHGVDASRLCFAPRVASRAEHLARIALSDLSLDAIGWHCGHSTTNETLWTGVPVLTAEGDRFASRVGCSLLTAAGLPEMIARDARDYVAIATSLGLERERCAMLKHKLAANRQHAALFDQPRIVNGLEAVYLEMWRQHRTGLKPQRIALR